ncbi:hypothetical protein RCL1_007995 [Eukaryota sp. TZLM3-RCL]
MNSPISGKLLSFNSNLMFGNSTTLESFKYLYLNEAFAEYLGYLCTSALFPEWNYMNQCLGETTIPGQKLDSLISSHAIEVELSNPRQIDEIFDDITYLKGAALVSMICKYLGPEKFQKSLQSYLSKFQLKNTNSFDLWSVFSEISEINLNELMNSWVLQKNYPLIQVSKLTENVCLRQSCFTDATREDVWQVPLSLAIYRKDHETEYEKLVFNEKLTLFDLSRHHFDPNSVLVVNPDKNSFCRVEYSPELLADLLAKLHLVSDLDLLSIVDDAFHLSKKSSTLSHFDRVITPIVDEILRRGVENLTATVDVVLGHLFDLKVIFDPVKINPMIVRLVKPILNQIDWKGGQNPTLDLVRSNSIILLSLSRDDDVINNCVEIFNSSVPSGLKCAVYTGYGLQSAENFNKLFEIFDQNISNPIEVSNILRAIGYCANNENLVNIWNFAKSEKVKKQDWVIIMRSIGKVFGIQEKLFELWSTQFDEIYDKMPSISVSSGISACLSGITCEELKENVVKFLNSKNVASLSMTIPQIIERNEINSKFVDRSK